MTVIAAEMVPRALKDAFLGASLGALLSLILVYIFTALPQVCEEQQGAAQGSQQSEIIGSFYSFSHLPLLIQTSTV